MQGNIPHKSFDQRMQHSKRRAVRRAFMTHTVSNRPKNLGQVRRGR